MTKAAGLIEGKAAASLLDVERLSVNYGKVPALHDVSLHVGVNEIVAVIGANGAGKTTLLSALVAAIPSRGLIRFDGADHASTTTTDELVGRGVALVPEQLCLFGSMSVEDNLRLGAFRLRREGKGVVDDGLGRVFALFPRLKERRRQTAATLSGGERRMLGIGRALMSRPRLLMLDEPSLGLAPLIVRELFDAFETLRAENMSLLLVEQHARAVLRLADRCYVLHFGRVILDSPAASLANDPRIEAAYLGPPTLSVHAPERT